MCTVSSWYIVYVMPPFRNVGASVFHPFWWRMKQPFSLIQNSTFNFACIKLLYTLSASLTRTLVHSHSCTLVRMVPVLATKRKYLYHLPLFSMRRCVLICLSHFDTRIASSAWKMPSSLRSHALNNASFNHIVQQRPYQRSSSCCWHVQAFNRIPKIDMRRKFYQYPDMRSEQMNSIAC